MHFFETPVINISTFEVEDIITTSDPEMDDDGFNNEVVKP